MKVSQLAKDLVDHGVFDDGLVKIFQSNMVLPKGKRKIVNKLNIRKHPKLTYEMGWYEKNKENQKAHQALKTSKS